MKKRFITGFIAAVMAVSMLLTGCGAGNSAPSETTTEKAMEKVTPTFMYFMSGSDADYETAKSVVSELQTEYEGKVNFDIVNVDEDKEKAANFPVEGNTPMLIMLNTDNDISAISPKCSDKEELKQAIDAALN